MKNQSRRSFCQRCITAGAGMRTVVSLAAETLPDENMKNRHSDMNLDYAKIGYCGYRCDICPGRSEDRQVRRKMVAG